MHENKPSATALTILKSTLFLSYDTRLKGIVPEEMYRISRDFLESNTLNKKRIIKMYKWPLVRLILRALEHMTVPGIMLHYILRKRNLEEITLESIADEVKQIVVFAAGFDTLACRLARQFPDLLFIEVDHPATQNIKKKLIEEKDWTRRNLIFLAADFSKNDLDEKFSSMERFDRKKKSLFIAEGITMYLKEKEINHLFGFIAGNSSLGSRLAFTFMEKRPNGSIDFENTTFLLKTWLALKKETFKWGLSKKEAPVFLEELNFSAKEIIGDETLRSKYLTGFSKDLSLAKGECIALVERK